MEKLGDFIKIRQFQGHNGPVKNQFEIETRTGLIFQSYNSIIAYKPRDKNEKIILDKHFWDHSKTTGRYRNLFLGEEKKETEKKIKSGEYICMDLNN